MAQQGSLFRLLINKTNYRSFLNASCRITIAGHQQYAGIKPELRNKIEDLNIPMKPKKPPTSYFRYAHDQKQNLVKNFPNLKLIEISKKLSEDWASASPSLKEEYSNLFKNEMELYKKLLDEYNMKLTPVQKEALELLNQAKKDDKKRRLTRKLIKEEAKPKRPIGPYMLYLIATSKREGLKINEIISLMKGKWAMLSDFEKDKYKEIFEENKKSYEAEMKVWEAKMIEEGKLHLVRQSTLSDAKPSRLTVTDVKNVAKNKNTEDVSIL